MKKKLAIILISLVFSFKGISQDTFKLSKDGFNAVVLEVPSMSAEEIYSKTINWISETYKNPKEVIKGDIKNEKVIVSGFSADAWYYNNLGTKIYYGMDYRLIISFKEGRYKIEFIIEKFTDKGAVAMHKVHHFFKEDGTIRKMYSEAPNMIESKANYLLSSLNDYLIKGGLKNEDW